MEINNTHLRNLNDYESMLATMTCNVGISLSIQGAAHHYDIDSCLFLAWSRCVAERLLLQVKVVPRKDEVGPLGQRYTLEPIRVDPKRLFVIQHRAGKSAMPDLVRELQRIGTTALDISKGSYFVTCCVNAKNEDKLLVHVIISLCHSLSDGPGALRVARSFLDHLGDVLKDNNKNSNEMLPVDPQPVTDLQALILGSDCAGDQEVKPVFEGQEEFVAALASNSFKMKNVTVLPPEAMQNIPVDDGFGGPSCIECVCFTLTAQETTALRDACRQEGTTIQGAITAASIKTRVKLLGLNPPVEAAVQVPVNTRSLAGIDQDECLCGSAGVWHLARLQPGENLFALARRSTEAVQAGLQEGRQPREWLRRLFHYPATLPPYSLMVSSVGVAPVEESYGNVNVEHVFFLGGALRTDTPSQAQATMLHAVTFRDELTCMINFTSPTVAKSFVDETAKTLKAALLSMAKNGE